MKTFKFRFATFTFAVITFATLFFASCQKEQFQPEAINPPTEQEQALVSKEVAFTDASGKNTAVIRFSTNDPALFDELDVSTLFSIEPVFEIFEEESHAEAGSEAEGDIPAVKTTLDFEIISQQLEPGAIALTLVYEPKSNAVVDRVPMTLLLSFTTTADHVHVNITADCAGTYFYRKLVPALPFVLFASDPSDCAPVTECGYYLGSYQIQVKVWGYSGITSFNVVAYP